MGRLGSGKGLSIASLVANLQGLRVDRTAADLPQSTTGSLFNVTGGRVLILQLSGEVTTVIESQVNNVRGVYNPTVGSSENICTLRDINGDPVGQIYSLTGDTNEALNAKASNPKNPTLVPVGVVELECSASSTGQIKWSVWYIPLDDGAVVTAV